MLHPVSYGYAVGENKGGNLINNEMESFMVH